MGDIRLLLRWFLYGVLFEMARAAIGHVNVELEILQFDNPTGTSYHGSDFHSQRKCCDADSQKVNCPQQCDTSFVICLGGISHGRCSGPLYNDPSTKQQDKNSYSTTYDNRLVFTFAWNGWHSGPIEYVVNLMDYDSRSRQDIIDNFTMTTSFNISTSYEQSKGQQFSLRNYASIDFAIRVWCQDGYMGPDCSQQCSPHDNFHVCNSHHASTLIPSCYDQDVLTIMIPPGSTSVIYNYTPARIQQLLFDFISKEICQNATRLDVNIIRLTLTRSIEFKATCDGTSVDNLSFTTHLYVMSLARKEDLHSYFPSLSVPTVSQKITSGSRLYMMLEVTSYRDSSTNCAGHTCNVQINICTKHISQGCDTYSMLESTTFHGGNLTICDGKVASGTSNKYLIGSTTWPIISTDIKFNRKVIMSQHNKVIPTTYKAESTYDKARPYEMILSYSSHRLAIKFVIWCAVGYSGDRCQHSCKTSGNHECNKDGHVVCKSGYHTSSCTDINECARNPCMNGGTCHDTDGSFICICPSGWVGPSCELDIDECAMNYCGSSATNCTNTPGSYTCTCISNGFNHDNCTDSNECLGKPCTNGATCYNVYGSYHCNCVDGFHGTRCDQDIDECQLQVCGNHSISCVNTANSYNCSCKPGWSGKTCKNDIDECTSKPCNGQCVNTPGSYKCACQSGWTGENCQNHLNECSKNPCKNNGTCSYSHNRYHCICPSNWTGMNCTTDIDECKTNPCVHGSCINAPGSYTCSCDRGYVGVNCETNRNECMSLTICANNGTCIDLSPPRYFECKCQPGYSSSSHCHRDIDECANPKQPCLHGKCMNTQGSYSCSCENGWTGNDCSRDVDECQLHNHYCHNNSTCVNTQGGYTCKCAAGWSGFNCTTDIDECSTLHPCKNRATCKNIPGGYSCSCTTGWTGTNCSNDIDECKMKHPCMNNATCRNTQGGYACKCATGWTGPNCDHDIDECHPSNPCNNEAMCQNIQGGYVCKCASGWTGPNCDRDIDECHPSNPCKNEARCQNTQGGYVCECASGRTGADCTIDINECASIRPCKNNASCRNTNGGFSCRCMNGWIGQNCSVDINECQTVQPCINHGTCQNTRGGYTCKCLTGWSGVNCSIDIDECSNTQNPCQHGQCVNTPGSYKCSCQSGWTGKNCQNHLNECSKNPCKNNGSCSNSHDRYVCICLSNWTGMNCTTDIDECKTNPCVHGTCINAPGSYSCSCDRGFEGVNCEINRNECTSHTICANNGTCVDLPPPNYFDCKCLPGWSSSSHCHREIDECANTNQTCLHGKCTNTLGSYSCLCEHGWTGNNCGHDVDECQFHNNDCFNNSTCVNTEGGYTCKCDAGWTGPNCTIDIDECDAYTPCRDNGTCFNLQGSYYCICTSGWSGTNCSAKLNEFQVTSELPTYLAETSHTTTRSEITLATPSVKETTMLPVTNTNLVDGCSHIPCQNNGTCVSMDNDTVCNCTNSWTGRNCTKDVNECMTDICAGNGVCVNTEGSYSCLHLGDAIHPACTGSSWNITANMTILREMYPTITSNHVFFGDNSCQGIEKGSLLVFQQGFQECLTSKRVTDGTLFYENILYYAIYDPINPFIIRQHKWTFTVECDVNRNEATSSHVHHETNSEHATVAGHYQINMAFYTDPNFQTQIPGNPIHASVGNDIYVKVFTDESDWTVKMRLHTCFTKPNDTADDKMNYYIIKDGCEVDSNTHIMSQSTHETKFVFQDFEYSTNKEGLDIYCNATFCETKDFSPGCAQACINVGEQAFIGK